MINIVANSIGPRVEVMNGVKEIDFGTMEVLKDKAEKITIKNNSRIVADFHAFTKNKNSVFKPIEKKGVLKPDESKVYIYNNFFYKKGYIYINNYKKYLNQ